MDVKIYVIPLNEEGYALLNDQLASKVRILAIEGKLIHIFPLQNCDYSTFLKPFHYNFESGLFIIFIEPISIEWVMFENYFGVNENNAWSIGGGNVVFGDGDGVNYRPFSAATEVVAHEITHEIIGAEIRLGGTPQADAINESVETTVHWAFAEVGIADFWKISTVSSGKLLDVTGVSKTAGTYIQIWEYTGVNDNQLWQLRQLSDTYYLFRAKHSGQCLAVPTGSTAPGVRVWQWPQTSTDWQRWGIFNKKAYPRVRWG